ncbi:CAP domain-containing protein [uncultured Amnibacterium sp.]|uniref:CAP domain-containing protein n=1 Tax=uncultured Amnibacterium sp. TaxID=1631851 RepID=UPI0035CC5887
MRSSRSRSRSRSLFRVVTLAVVGAVVFGGASAATAFALDAQQTSPAARAPIATPTARATTIARATTAATAAPTASTRSATVVRGWAAAPTSVTAGKTFRAFVLVSGDRRTVRLERLVRGAWRVLDTDRTSRNGAATVAWRTPKAAGRAVLRVHALRSAEDGAAVTAKKALTTAAAATAAPTATPTATPTTPAPVATAAPVPAGAEALRAQLLTLVNQARATARSCGATTYPAAPALQRSTALDTAAGAYALKMGQERFFDHTSPDGSTMVSRLKAVGITNTTERENIAAGQTSAASVMAGWLKSPGHCANIMAKDVTRIGLGHATVQGSPYGQYWVQDFAG